MPSSTQWGGAALAARDSKARKSESEVAAVDNLDLSGFSEAASRVVQIDEYGDDDDEFL